MICAIGNVGKLACNLNLIPEARPDHGRLDVYVASPHRFSHWTRVFLRLITRGRAAMTTLTCGRAGKSKYASSTPTRINLTVMS